MATENQKLHENYLVINVEIRVVKCKIEQNMFSHQENDRCL